MTAATLTKGPPRPLSERLFAAAAFVIGIALVMPVLTIIVLGSGLYLWWVRRRAPANARERAEVTA